MFIYGTADDDEFILTHSGVEETVKMFGGNDVVAESKDFQTISNDIFFGGMGNDTITSYWGNDVIRSGPGDDMVFLHGPDAVYARGGSGYDIVYIGPDDSGHGPHRWSAAEKGDDLPPEHNLKGFEEVVFL